MNQRFAPQSPLTKQALARRKPWGFSPGGEALLA